MGGAAAGAGRGCIAVDVRLRAKRASQLYYRSSWLGQIGSAPGRRTAAQSGPSLLYSSPPTAVF